MFRAQFCGKKFEGCPFYIGVYAPFLERIWYVFDYFQIQVSNLVCTWSKSMNHLHVDR